LLQWLHQRRFQLATWLAWCLLVALPVRIALYTLEPPEPRPASAPASDFSEGRARAIVSHLASTIGPRPAGSPGARAAVEYLVEQLRAIPGVEVRVQEAGGLSRDPLDGTPVAWATRNVLALLPGDGPEAVLVSAHYDTVPASPGAADDGAGVACAIEALRALSGGPPRRHSVVLNLNGAEEVGLFGARGFMEDSWFSTVRAFVNLEAAGSGGRALLFRTAGADNPALAAYSRRVTRPWASAAGHDLFAHDLVPLATDFDVYAEAGLPGIDLAFIDDGWSYHDAADSEHRLQPGSLQHMGDGLLSVLEELATGDLPPPSPAGRPAVFFDVLGLTLLGWSAPLGWLIAALAAGFVAAACALCVRWGRLGLGDLLAGAGVTLLAIAAGAVASVGAAWLLGALHRGQLAWHARPWLAGLGHGALALAGGLAVHSRWARSGGDDAAAAQRRSLAGWAGALATAAAVVIWMQVEGLSSVYLAVVWVVPAALALLGAALLPRAAALLFAAAFVPGALLTAEASVQLVRFAAPVSGMLALGGLRAPLMAVAVSAPTLIAAAWVLPALHPARGLGRVGLAAACVGVAGLAASALLFPYTPERPRRLLAEHRQVEDPAEARLLLAPMDEPDIPAAFPGVAAQPAAGERVQGRPAALTLPASHVTLQPSGVVPLAATWDAERSTRLLVLRVAGRHAHQVELGFPRQRLRASSFGPVVGRGGAAERYWVRVLAPPPQGLELRFELQGEEPVPVSIRELYPLAPPGSLAALATLPDWTTVSSFASSTRVEAF